MATCAACGAKLLPDRDSCRLCELVAEPPVSAPSEEAWIGRRVGGDIRVEALIGEGSMGRVYAARREPGGEPLALKVVHSHLTTDSRTLMRFQREARAAALADHEHTVQIKELGAERHHIYIAMELVEGPNLLQVIEAEHPHEIAWIVEILGQSLLALEAAHRAGIIHRDFKPENVIVTSDASGKDVAKVCDFGMAKIQEAHGLSAITASGFVCGTPEYMAPEQIRSERVDARADVYAAGCVLYQLLVAAPPFRAPTILATLRRHLGEAPLAPREARPDLRIPAAIEAVCLRAMRKNATERFASALSMKQALDAALDAPLETALDASLDAPLERDGVGALAASLEQDGAGAPAASLRGVEEASLGALGVGEEYAVAPHELRSEPSSAVLQSAPRIAAAPGRAPDAETAAERAKPPWPWPILAILAVLAVLAVLGIALLASGAF
ncbi:MAG: serine/threonine protein kinase [Myxococcales bacterium]|nr:serine/threonine protein kinase [Myxococcales bacterium]